MAEGIKLLACGSTQSYWGPSKEIGPEGGSIAFRGHQLRIPPGALSEPLVFTLGEVSSDFLDLEVRFEHANRANAGDVFSFSVPAQLTLNYARCRELPSGLVRIYAASGDGEIADDLGGTDDRSNKRVTTSVTRLASHYLVGAPTPEPASSIPDVPIPELHRLLISAEIPVWVDAEDAAELLAAIVQELSRLHIYAGGEGLVVEGIEVGVTATL